MTLVCQRAGDLGVEETYLAKEGQTTTKAKLWYSTIVVGVEEKLDPYSYENNYFFH